jgi:hypothetical protein
MGYDGLRTAKSEGGTAMVHRFRTIDLTLPLVLVAGLLVASNPPALVRGQPAQIPVTGTIQDPCTGEEIVLGGTADVRVRSSVSGDGGFRIEVLGNLAEATATSASGTRYELGGAVDGKGETYGPFPAALEVDGHGALVNETAAANFTARVRFHLSVEEDGSAAPTGSAEVAALECRG